MAANLGLSNWNKIKKIILPSIFPGIVVGLRIALGAAWINLVAGEMMGVRSGLGYLILDSRNMFRTDLVIAGMIIIGLLGLSLDHFIRWIERRVESKWGRNH
jgi:NitT/TauT family transport system permease protein